MWGTSALANQVQSLTNRPQLATRPTVLASLLGKHFLINYVARSGLWREYTFYYNPFFGEKSDSFDTPIPRVLIENVSFFSTRMPISMTGPARIFTPARSLNDSPAAN